MRIALTSAWRFAVWFSAVWTGSAFALGMEREKGAQARRAGAGGVGLRHQRLESQLHRAQALDVVLGA
jgi:hypothetical protein